MCSGKSTVGRALAEKLGWVFLDMDEELQKIESMTITDIFELKGESYFRQKEFELLKEKADLEKVVISTGGGLGANIQALELMKSKGLVVWLRIDFETFLSRCGQDPTRPLLKKSRAELLEVFESRSGVYSQSHLKLEATSGVNDLVEQILLAC